MFAPSSLSKYFAIILLLSLTACGIKPLEIFTTPVEKPALNIQMPDGVHISPIKWFVITPENSKSVFKRVEKSKSDLVLFGLTDDGYQNLSSNYAEMLKYIIEQKTIIKQYQNYYEPNINNTKDKKDF